MISLLLLLSLALAQEPQSFPAFPASIVKDGQEYAGLLIDEETAIELADLRVRVRALDREYVALSKSCEEKDQIFTVTIDALRKHHEESLRAAQERTFRERHGLEAGIATGAVATLAVVVLTAYALGQLR